MRPEDHGIRATREAGRSMTYSAKDIRRFRSCFTVAAADDCWNWTGNETGHAGHGRLWAGGRKTLATHVALTLDGRPRQGDLCALHSCDNPACVNPRHLRWGTQLDNIRDREARGRGGAARGRANPRAKLSADVVLDLRQSKRPLLEDAKRLGVCIQTIANVKSEKTWRHV